MLIKLYFVHQAIKKRLALKRIGEEGRLHNTVGDKPECNVHAYENAL